MDENVFTDAVGGLEELKRRLEQELLNNLYINAKVKLVEPKTLERSMGKAKRIVDRRELIQK